uniref:Uncharacterized protein n=1 Tax=Rhizophora mucronata TaxID=61149 RepID=A0A2P2IXB5_RHIMU
MSFQNLPNMINEQRTELLYPKRD